MKVEHDFVGLHPGVYSLEGTALINQATGEHAVRAEQPTGTVDKDRYYLFVRDNNLAYFMHNKTLGSLESDVLEEVAWNNVSFAHDVADSEPHASELRSEYYELAASAFVETAMTQTFDADELIEEVDARLGLIDLADECLELAISALPEEQTSMKHRLKVKLLFSRVHRDIVCGEIIEETVEDLTQALYEELLSTINDIDTIHARGLAGELRAYWHYWSEFHETGLAVIPATVRGDSGFYNRKDTHDFDVLSQRADGNWNVETPREIKRRRITQWMLRRYTGSDLVYANPLHGVHTIQKAKSA